ncbi:MAG: DMT family transporter [Alphaproteobacteria bacterium]|nr:DMT family transporter [Alphaproteobacteria bacterium]
MIAHLSRLSPNQRGALWLLGSSAAFAAMNGVIKLLGSDIPTSQLVLFRCLFGLVALSPFILANPRQALVVSRPGLHVLRALLGVAAMSANFWCVANLPLASATSLFFTKPLFMPLLAALFLGERFRLGRGLATLVGFLGVLAMLNPQDGADPMSLGVGLAGAFCVALVMIVIKKLTLSEQPLAVLVWFTLLSTLGAAPFAAMSWVTPDFAQWGLLASLGFIGTLGQYLLIRAYRVGEASAITPIDFTQLLFAGLMGLLFFGELPSLQSWAGIAIIVAAALFLTLQERKSAPSRPLPGDLL